MMAVSDISFSTISGGRVCLQVGSLYALNSATPISYVFPPDASTPFPCVENIPQIVEIT